MSRGSHRKSSTTRRRRSSLGRPKATYDIVEEEIPSNEIDEFMAARDKVALDTTATQLNHDDDDEDIHELFTLNVHASSEDDDDDDDEDKHHHHLTASSTLNDDDMSDGDADDIRERTIKQENDIALDWGSRASAYYAGQDARNSDEDIEQDDDDEDDTGAIEAAEALRLQQLMLGEHNNDDFVDTDIIELVKAKKASSTNASSALSSLDTDLNTINLDFDDNEKAEKLAPRPLSSIASLERMSMVAQSSPEIIGVLSELRQAISTLTQALSNTEEIHDANSEHGMSLLQVQIQLMHMYCVNLVFFLLLKSEGRVVAGHPVVERLVTIRVKLEKIAPLHNKLKHFVDKMVRSACMADDDTHHHADTAVSSIDHYDPLHYKPDPTAFQPNDMANVSCVNDAELVSTASSSLHTNIDGDGVYKPPRNRMVMYDEDGKHSDSVAKRNKQRVKKARASSLYRDIANEFSEAPEEIRDSVGGVADEDHPVVDVDEEERKNFEESNFIRTMVNKVDRKKLNKQRRLQNNALDELDDFEDLTSFLDERTQKQQSEDMSELDKLRAAKRHRHHSSSSSSSTTAAATTTTRHSSSSSSSIVTGAIGGLDDDLLIADEMYEHAERNALIKKHKKQKRKVTTMSETHNQVYYAPVDNDGDTATPHRVATKSIVKNRGLKRYRSKLDKNPRVSARRKYDKALKKRRSQVGELGASHNAVKYGGELTGIKTKLTRSVKLQQ